MNPAICAVDIGSPEKRKLGWAGLKKSEQNFTTSKEIDDIAPFLSESLSQGSAILSLESPLSIPWREKSECLTQRRQGEGSYAWTAGAGASVLAVSIPIMLHIFRQLHEQTSKTRIFLNEHDFKDEPHHLMIVEGFVTSKEHGRTPKSNESPERHMEDAKILGEYIRREIQKSGKLPESSISADSEEEWVNLAALALLRVGLIDDAPLLGEFSPVMRPKGRSD